MAALNACLAVLLWPVPVVVGRVAVVLFVVVLSPLCCYWSVTEAVVVPVPFVSVLFVLLFVVCSGRVVLRVAVYPVPVLLLLCPVVVRVVVPVSVFVFVLLPYPLSHHNVL